MRAPIAGFGGISLRDIEYVVAISDTGSFTAAAERCGVSQPSLSGQVRKVENQLGLKIFERTGRDVRLTPAGADIVEQARSVLGEARRMFDLSHKLNDPLAGTLRLGVIATLGPYLVPHLLGPLQSEFPDMKLQLREGLTADLGALVVGGELDAVLLSVPVEDDRLMAMPILFEPFVGMCSRRSVLSRKDVLDMEDLDTGDLLLMDEGHCIRGQALALCSNRHPGRETRHAASIETLRHLVAAGSGHALLPKLAARTDARIDVHVRYTPLSDSRAGRDIGLAWRRTDVREKAFRRLATFIGGLEIEGTTPATAL
jgi:LysR family hydrogen peroxide-inducible transcriptional activator